MKKNLFWKYFLVIVLLIFSLFLRVNSFNSPFERDEGEYSYSAWILKEGLVPYRDAFLQKPPMIIYTYYLGQILSPKGLWPPRLLGLLFTVGSSILLGLIIKKEFNDNRAAILSMFLCSLMLAFPYFMGFSANTETFMLLPFMGVLTLFGYYRSSLKGKYFFWAGVLASLALGYKPICLYALVVIFICWLINLWRINKSLVLIVRSMLLFILGGLIAASIQLIPFEIKGVFGYFWETAVAFNILYSKMWGWGLTNLIRQLELIIKHWWIILPFFGWFFLMKNSRKWFYVILLLSCLLGVYQSPIGHYYLFLMPAMALMVSVGFSNLIKFVENKIPFLLASLILVVFLLAPSIKQFSLTPEEINTWVYGTVNPFSEATLVADKLADITKPDDKVFIAGSEPEILFYAQRKSVSRFVITYPLIMDTPKRLDYQKEAINELKNNPPRAIVYSLREQSGLWNEESPKLFIEFLDSLIAKDYQLVGGYVWEREKGYWEDSLPIENKNFASLLLYSRKD